MQPSLIQPLRFHYIVPSDLGCPVAANANPATCAPFEAMVFGMLCRTQARRPRSPSSPTCIGSNDSSTVGSGFLHVDGIDWNASYDVDLGDLGAWNTGITGTYYLHSWTQTVTGGPIVDALHQNLFLCRWRCAERRRNRAKVEIPGTFGLEQWPVRYRRIHELCIALFLADRSDSAQCQLPVHDPPAALSAAVHYHARSATSPITEPSFITFDLSFGYKTGDMPANDYLKRITLQFTVQNLLNRHSPFDYLPNNAAGRQAAAYDITRPNSGRTIGMTLVKNW